MENQEIIVEPQREKVTLSTIIRTVCLALALTNQVLTIMGHSPLPIADETLKEFITLGATIVASVVAWWKNNSFTQKAIKADKTFKG